MSTFAGQRGLAVYLWLLLLLLLQLFSLNIQSLPSSSNRSINDAAILRMPPKFLRDPNAEVSVALWHGDNIANVLSEIGFCDTYTSSADKCEIIKAKLNLQLYNHMDYAPSKASATLEDFYADKIDIIRYIIRRYNYITYLEIGCFQDENFANVIRILAKNKNLNNINDDISDASLDLKLGTSVVGVDPASGGTHRMTSDEWFASNANSSANGSKPLTFDLVLVDGLHHASQALDDIVNALNILNVGGTILFHDTNPNVYSAQVTPRSEDTNLWNGDVWKVLAPLRLMSDIEVVVVDIDHGLGAVRRRRNRHRLDSTWRDKIQFVELNSSNEGTGDSNRSSANYFPTRDYRNFKCNLDAITWEDLRQNRQELLRLMTVSEFRVWLDSEEDISSITYPSGN